MRTVISLAVGSRHPLVRSIFGLDKQTGDATAWCIGSGGPRSTPKKKVQRPDGPRLFRQLLVRTGASLDASAKTRGQGSSASTGVAAIQVSEDMVGYLLATSVDDAARFLTKPNSTISVLSPSIKHQAHGPKYLTNHLVPNTRRSSDTLKDVDPKSRYR